MTKMKVNEIAGLLFDVLDNKFFKEYKDSEGDWYFTTEDVDARTVDYVLGEIHSFLNDLWDVKDVELETYIDVDRLKALGYTK